MNLLCPNCQKTLTVPEQYAGQLMKCPLCNGTFTVPNLPAGGGSTDPGALPAPPPLAPVGSAPPAPPAPPDTYAFKQEPQPAPPLPTFSPAASEPPPLGPLDPGLPPTQPGAITSTPPAGSVPSLSGYTRIHTIYLSDRALQWVPPVAVFLIFVLSFFSWVGLYPGGVPSLTQSAWNIVGGGASYVDPDISPRITPAEVPWSASMLLYCLLLLVTVVFTIFCVAWPFLEPQLKHQIPPAVAQFIPVRWGIAALLNVAVFLVLLIPVLFGFPLESKAREQASTQYNVETAKGTKGKLETQREYGRFLEEVKRPFTLSVVVFLHILTILSTALVFWIEQRGPAWPLPKIELAW
jgi:hypothetical protein